MPYEDLIKEFGSKSKESSTPTVETPYHDLIKEFGGGAVEAAPPVQAPTTPITPTVVRPPISGVSPEESARINALPVNVDTSVSPSSAFGRDMQKLPIAVGRGIQNFPSEYNKDVEQANKDFGQGFVDISQGKAATGAGEVVLGAIKQIAARSAATTVLRKTQELLTNLTGNKEFGERATDVMTSGLPIAKAAKFTVKSVPVNRAFATIVDSIGSENLDKTISILKSNPRLTIMDVSPEVQIITQGLASKPGKSRDVLNSAVAERTATAKGAVTDAYNETMGAPVNVLEKLDAMKAKARETGATAINPVVEAAGPADITDVIKHIDNAISSSGMVEKRTLEALKKGESPSLPLSENQSQLFNVRERLRGDWKDRDQMFLDVRGEQGAHNIQKDLRARAQALLDSPEPSNRLLGGKLMGIRNRIVEAIDKQTGGKYKEGLGKYADDMDVQDAFKSGTEIFRNRPSVVEDRPEYLAKWLKTAKEDEILAKREGARVAVDNQLRGFKSAARKGTDIPEIEFNAEKMKLLFGEEETKSMLQKLQHERMIADTNNKLFQNSQTAMRLQGAEATAVRPPYKPNFSNYLPMALEAGTAYASGGNVMGAGLLAGYGYEGARKLMNKAGQALDHRTNTNIAELASATGEARENLIKALETIAAQQGKSVTQKVQNKIQRFALPVLPP